MNENQKSIGSTFHVTIDDETMQFPCWYFRCMVWCRNRLSFLHGPYMVFNNVVITCAWSSV